ncbi:MAG: NAD(P)-binding domain-containing protein, partial [Candidatus Levybacteria bacterium]|nr:NAD(P)-binding domain-containing protein [Candidatus Levybacteria bacterium]
MQIGWLGFGKMGSRMVFKLLVDGHQVVVWNRSSKPVEEFKTQNSKLKIITQNVKVANSIEDLMTHLQKPRIIWLMLPAGEASESVLTEVIKLVEPGDIIIDGGNAHFSDTERRSKNLS